MSVATQVRERPILFSGPMVRAILDGRKTQTRRVLANNNSDAEWSMQEYLLDDPRTFVDPGFGPPRMPSQYLHAPLDCAAIERRMGWERGGCDPGVIERIRCRHVPGDRLWVRETWAPMCRTADPHCWCETDEQRAKSHWTEYRADSGAPYPGEWPAEEARGYDDAPKWRPSIHMPRARSRLSLEVTGVRVQRLQDITEADAGAEGLDTDEWGAPSNDLSGTRRGGFAVLWDSLNAARGYGWAENPWVWVIEFKVVTP